MSFAPSTASRRAIAAPIPREEPVTSATLSVNRMCCSGTWSRLWHGWCRLAKIDQPRRYWVRTLALEAAGIRYHRRSAAVGLPERARLAGQSGSIGENAAADHPAAWKLRDVSDDRDAQ